MSIHKLRRDGIVACICIISAGSIQAEFNFKPYTQLPTGYGNSIAAVGDFNNDGRDDVASHFSRTDALTMNLIHGIRIQLQSPQGELETKDILELDSTSPFLQIKDLAAGDLNGDGLQDLAVSYESFDTYPPEVKEVAVFTQTANGQLIQAYKLYPANNHHILIDDLNGDGLDDLATLETNIELYYQSGNALPALANVQINLQPDYAPYNHFTAGDINGDGSADFILESAPYLHSGLSVVKSDGNGGFSPDEVINLGLDIYGYPNYVNGFGGSVTIGDLNSDSLQDVAASYNGSLGNSAIAIFFQQNDGTLGPLNSIQSFESPENLLSVDLDGDNKKELVVYHTSTPALGIYTQTGVGLSSEQIVSFPYHVFPFGAKLLSGDLNGDGLTDIALKDGTYGWGIGILYNNINPALPGTPDVYLSQHVFSNSEEVVQGSSIELIPEALDSDGFIVDYQWRQVSGISTEIIPSPTGETATVNVPVLTSEGYAEVVIEVEVTDNNGLKRSAQFLLMLLENKLPIADAGSDLLVQQADAVNLNGGASYDVEGPIEYSWQQISGPQVALSGANTASPSFSAPILPPTESAVLIFELTVTDSIGATASDQVAIFVEANSPPIADAGADQIINRRDTVTLDGTGSTDDVAIISFHWAQVSGQQVALNNSNSAIATFTAPKLIMNQEIQLVFELTVTDGLGLSSADQVMVTVQK